MDPFLSYAELVFGHVDGRGVLFRHLEEDESPVELLRSFSEFQFFDNFFCHNDQQKRVFGLFGATFSDIVFKSALRTDRKDQKRRVGRLSIISNRLYIFETDIFGRRT